VYRPQISGPHPPEPEVFSSALVEHVAINAAEIAEPVHGRASNARMNDANAFPAAMPSRMSFECSATARAWTNAAQSRSTLGRSRSERGGVEVSIVMAVLCGWGPRGRALRYRSLDCIAGAILRLPATATARARLRAGFGFQAVRAVVGFRFRLRDATDVKAISRSLPIAGLGSDFRASIRRLRRASMEAVTVFK